jgi:hypothetical protein
MTLAALLVSHANRKGGKKGPRWLVSNTEILAQYNK